VTSKGKVSGPPLILTYHAIGSWQKWNHDQGQPHTDYHENPEYAAHSADVFVTITVFALGAPSTLLINVASRGIVWRNSID
jgi:hypothetical protein